MSEQGGVRIAAAFARARTQGRCALIPYIVAGDPNIQTTRLVLQGLVRSGADIIELGVPYSDPLADGPSIVAAGQRSLDAGTNLDQVIDLIADVRVPVVLFTYANPVMRYGIKLLAKRLADVGAAGLIVPDLPLEEMLVISHQLELRGIAVPLLIAPTTPPARAKKILSASRGFVYLVSRLGVTGAGVDQRPDPSAILGHVAQLRTMTKLPIAVGFGIADPNQVAAIASEADGAIVGSALIDAMSGLHGEAAAYAVAEVLEYLRTGTARRAPGSATAM